MSNADCALALVGALLALGALCTAVGAWSEDGGLIDGGAMAVVLALWLASHVVADLRVDAPQHERSAPSSVRP